MKIIVRFVTETKSGKCWFEEKVALGNWRWEWAPIEETRKVCEVNSRHALTKVIEARKEGTECLDVGPEETFEI